MTRARFWLRRLGLAGSGATFGVIGLASLFAPNQVAARYAYTLGSADAFNEFHAIFTGFWLGLAALFFMRAMMGELVTAIAIVQGGAVTDLGTGEKR